MVVYHVRWIYDSSLGKGNGRLTNSSKIIDGLVLCRNPHHALSCLQFLFRQVHLNDGVTLEDGEIICKRIAVDSRNIVVNYLMLDGMKEPLYLTDIPSNMRRLSNIFQIPTFY